MNSGRKKQTRAENFAERNFMLLVCDPLFMSHNYREKEKVIGFRTRPTFIQITKFIQEKQPSFTRLCIRLFEFDF